MPTDTLSIEALCAGLDLPDWVLNFEHSAAKRVVFGPGKLDLLGQEAGALGAKKALLVTDPGIAQTGAVERAVSSLRDAGVSSIVYDEVRENPTTEDVDRCVAAASAGEIDLIVGLGGGSSMDTAKGSNFILTNGGKMQDYWGVEKATQPMLPLIAIPTTSGTGSECQSFALIADAKTHAKMACGDSKVAPAVAILDPSLTLTMPRRVTAHTGVDAIAHALETAVCNKRSDISSAYSRAGWLLLDSGLDRVLAHPADLEARAQMQLGAAFAGTAIENSMLGIAHSCANPLTAHFGIVHGQAVGTMLPEVVSFNSRDPEVAEIYRSLFDGDLPGRLKDHLIRADMAAPLSEQGVFESLIVQMAEEAANQWTAQFNPVPVSAVDLESVYRAAF